MNSPNCQQVYTNKIIVLITMMVCLFFNCLITFDILCQWPTQCQTAVPLTHCGPVTPNSIPESDWHQLINTGSGNGLVPDSTKSLPKPKSLLKPNVLSITLLLTNFSKMSQNKSVLWQNIIWKCHLLKWRPFGESLLRIIEAEWRIYASVN